MKYILFLLVTTSSCSAKETELDKQVRIDNTKIVCLKELINLAPEYIRNEIGSPCNKNFDCIERWLKDWEKKCFSRNGMKPGVAL